MILITISVLLFFLYAYLKIHFKYWDRKGVPTPKNSLIFGSVEKALTFRESLGTEYMKIYNDFKKFPYVGVFVMRSPGLMLRDPELVKNVLIRDFKCFEKNDFDIDSKVDPIFGNNAFTTIGADWKRHRNHGTPLFTSQKMKNMFERMMGVGRKLQIHLEAENTCINTKELGRKYTCDILGESAFGLNTQALEDPDSLFLKMAGNIFDDSLWSHIKQYILFALPSLSGILKVALITPELCEFIKTFVDKTMTYRRKHDLICDDYLGNLMQLQDKNPQDFSDQDVYANIGALMLDGIETSSIVFQFALYELARNPELQTRLKAEIDDFCLKSPTGVITYETLQEMSFLDRVFKETLRMYPALQALLKVCTQQTEFPSCDGLSTKPLTVDVGTKIIIPTLALHRDAQYYPNPDRFDPDRFLDEHMNGIANFAYLPFGNGPRVCVGRRFGEQQVKIAIMSVVQNFQISVNKKTKDPLEFDATLLLTVPKGGIHLDFNKRN